LVPANISLKEIGQRCKIGMNRIPNAIDAVVFCNHCKIYNLMPIGDRTRFVACMGCEDYLPVSKEEEYAQQKISGSRKSK
jgi:hypothetical protein